MKATVFTVTRHDLYVGAAVVSPEARYFSVVVPGVKAISRRSVTPEAWTLVVAEISAGFSDEPLPTFSKIVRLICCEDTSAYAVRCIAQPLIKTAASEQTGLELDKLLREVGDVGTRVASTSQPPSSAGRRSKAPTSARE